MSRWHKHEWDFLPEQAFALRPGGGMTLEGGKGGNSAPAPDPRLVEAQIRSMGIQDNAIQRILANSESMAPLQQEQMQFALDSAREAYADSRDDRAWMTARRGVLSGLQDRLVADANAFDSGERAQQLKAEAQADVNSAFSNAREQGTRAMARMGINPNSGKTLAMNNQTSLAQASALAGASRQANTQARQEGYALTDRATNALAGYPAMGMQATGAGAGYGSSAQMIANNGLAGLNSGFGAAGGLAGQMGSNATSMWGAQANYHANMQQQGESFGGILGGLGGFAAGMAKTGIFAPSDRRLKCDIVPVGTDERTGLALYEFSYRDDAQGRRYRGVMADEVQKVHPDAVAVDESGYMSVDYARLGIDFKEVA